MPRDPRNSFERWMLEPKDFYVGQRVCVSAENKYAADWRGDFVITGITYDYQRSGDVNIAIASDDDIKRGYGSTDGFGRADLIPCKP